MADIWDMVRPTLPEKPMDLGPIIEPPSRPVDIPQDETPQDITIGGGAEGTEQKAEHDYLKKGYEVDQLNNLRFSGQRKKNFI
jgi:hypothetical protein